MEGDRGSIPDSRASSTLKSERPFTTCPESAVFQISSYNQVSCRGWRSHDNEFSLLQALAVVADLDTNFSISPKKVTWKAR